MTPERSQDSDGSGSRCKQARSGKSNTGKMHAQERQWRASAECTHLKVKAQMVRGVRLAIAREFTRAPADRVRFNTRFEISDRVRVRDRRSQLLLA